ncbi:hypothetical protein CVT26_004885 [Gymnopilus dilepis]|uniref:Uncharacterized protein n=1 Tax=Gymnopilus dilepis TaxID=231916 RepID=A0A409W8I5_9AGAR|nr:hypothetical protein CVT26_004885 [Gymnopilus dilepis]
MMPPQTAILSLRNVRVSTYLHRPSHLGSLKIWCLIRPIGNDVFNRGSTSDWYKARGGTCVSAGLYLTKPNMSWSTLWSVKMPLPTMGITPYYNESLDCTRLLERNPSNLSAQRQRDFPGGRWWGLLAHYLFAVPTYAASPSREVKDVLALHTWSLSSSIVLCSIQHIQFVKTTNFQAP